MEPGPAEDWLELAHKLETSLHGQKLLPESSAEVQRWIEKAKKTKKSSAKPEGDRSISTITVNADEVQVEQAREAGPVHVRTPAVASARPK